MGRCEPDGGACVLPPPPTGPRQAGTGLRHWEGSRTAGQGSPRPPCREPLPVLTGSAGLWNSSGSWTFKFMY